VIRLDDFPLMTWELYPMMLVRGMLRGRIAASLHHVRRGLQACGVAYDHEYLLSDLVPAVVAFAGPQLVAVCNSLYSVRDVLGASPTPPCSARGSSAWG